jgi:hypothetical protein
MVALSEGLPPRALFVGVPSMKWAFLAALLISSAIPAYAAKIQVSPGKIIEITIQGVIGPDDFEAFKRQADTVGSGPALVDLESPGGNLFAALQIGEYIRSKRWATSVYDECDSSCAAIWLAGVLRYMSPIARIGFHAASMNGQEKGNSNALVGAYMTRLGLGYGAVLWATTAGPKDIAYLTPSKAKQLGIEVTVIDPDEKQANEQPTLPTPMEITPRSVTPSSEDICIGRLWVSRLASVQSTRDLKGPNACYFDPQSKLGKQVLSVCDEWGDNARHGCWIKGIIEGRPESERELMQIVEVRKVNLSDLRPIQAAIQPPLEITPRPVTPQPVTPICDKPIWQRSSDTICIEPKADGRDCSSISAELDLFFPLIFDDCFTRPAANGARLQAKYTTVKTWDRYIPSSQRYITRTLQACNGCAFDPYR